MLRLVGWVNELPERMKDPDPVVRRRAQTMQTWIIILIAASIMEVAIFMFGRELWIHGWSR